MWNEVLSVPSFCPTVFRTEEIDVNFNSNNRDFIQIRLTLLKPQNDSPAMGYKGTTTVSAYNIYESNSHEWEDEAYRIITFTTSFDRSTNPDFYDWFIQNAVKQS